MNTFLANVPRLILGTAQFGMSYGIANSKGKINFDQAVMMLEVARTAGIDTLDTAISYGDAESILGRIGVSNFRLVSKLPGLPKPISAVDDWVFSQTKSSLDRLGLSRLDCLLLHAPDDLFGSYGAELLGGILRVQDAGLVEKIGVSVYSPDQLETLLNKFSFQVVQIPANIFDRRFSETGWLSRLANAGIEVHARSIFLQGLLLMPADLIPNKFGPNSDHIKKWLTWLSREAYGVSPVQACLAHVASYQEIDRLVVGADSLIQLKEILTASQSHPLRAPDYLATDEIFLINPFLWNSI